MEPESIQQVPKFYFAIVVYEAYHTFDASSHPFSLDNEEQQR